MAKVRTVVNADGVAPKRIEETSLKTNLLAVYLYAIGVVNTVESLRQLFVDCNGDLSNFEDPTLHVKPVGADDSDKLEAAIVADPELAAYFALCVRFSVSAQAQNAGRAVVQFLNGKL